jgi:molybdate transport system ATP-binding protein
MLEVSIRRDLPGFTLDAAFRQEGRGVTALYGPSGAGKTSLILGIAGLLPKATGRVVLNGRVLLDSQARVNLPARERRIGVVFQDGRLFPHRTVRANLLYGANRAKRGAVAFDHVVGLLGVEALLDRRPLALSGGERQRVALGRALLSAPDLLLLDEPLAALDAARKAEILPYLERLRDEAQIPILYVSHAADEIARLADRIVALDSGRVTIDGPAEQAFARLGLSDPDGGDASAILTGTVIGAPVDGLSDLDLGQGLRLAAPALNAPSGARVRVQIRARDVMIALDPPGRVSANNILPVTVKEIVARGANDLLLLECAGQSLSAQITARAAQRLALIPGASAYAVIKTVTIAR